MNNRIKYNANEVQRNIFYQFPKFLMHDEEFADLSAQAKLLYMVLRDRHELSLRNKWIDEENNIFLICSREEMQKLLKVSNKTIVKIMTELKKYNLIDEQRRGQGNVNYIYLLTLESLENTEMCNFYISKNEHNSSLKMKEVHANNTYNKDTYMSDTEYPILSHQSVLEEQTEKEKTDMIRLDMITNHAVIDGKGQKNNESLNATLESEKHTKPSNNKYDYTEIQKKIKAQIDYDCLLMDHIADESTLNEIVFVITSTIATEYQDGYISMGDERVPAQAVREIFYKLNYENIQLFIESYNKQVKPITKTVPYIRKSLYYNYGSINHHYRNRVNIDFPQYINKKE